MKHKGMIICFVLLAVGLVGAPLSARVSPIDILYDTILPRNTEGYRVELIEDRYELVREENLTVDDAGIYNELDRADAKMCGVELNCGASFHDPRLRICECDSGWQDCLKEVVREERSISLRCDVTEWIGSGDEFYVVIGATSSDGLFWAVSSPELSTSILQLNAFVRENEERREWREEGSEGEGEDGDDDGVADGEDNCRDAGNADQADFDSDGVGDACDNCYAFENPEQRETEALLCMDTDNDGVADFKDSCTGVFDPTNQSMDCLSLGTATYVRSGKARGGCSLMPASSDNLISFALFVISIVFIRTRRRHTSQGR